MEKFPNAEEKVAKPGEHGEEPGFIENAAVFCRFVAGRVMCKIGDHQYEEVGREKYSCGEETVHLQCSRKDCHAKSCLELRDGEKIL